MSANYIIAGTLALGFVCGMILIIVTEWMDGQ